MSSVRATRGINRPRNRTEARVAAMMARPSAWNRSTSSDWRLDACTSARFARACSATDVSELLRRRFARDTPRIHDEKYRDVPQNKGATAREIAASAGSMRNSAMVKNAILATAAMASAAPEMTKLSIAPTSPVMRVSTSPIRRWSRLSGDSDIRWRNSEVRTETRKPWATRVERISST